MPLIPRARRSDPPRIDGLHQQFTVLQVLVLAVR